MSMKRSSKMNKQILYWLTVLSVTICSLHALTFTAAGPIMAGSAVAACYTACNVGYVTCLASSGIVAGATGPIGWWAWLTGAPAGCSLGESIVRLFSDGKGEAYCLNDR